MWYSNVAAILWRNSRFLCYAFTKFEGFCTALIKFMFLLQTFYKICISFANFWWNWRFFCKPLTKLVFLQWSLNFFLWTFDEIHIFFTNLYRNMHFFNEVCFSVNLWWNCHFFMVLWGNSPLFAAFWQNSSFSANLWRKSLFCCLWIKFPFSESFEEFHFFFWQFDQIHFFSIPI